MNEIIILSIIAIGAIILFLFYINRLSNLELAFEFFCPLIIREGAFYSNKVEDLLASTVVADVSPNQLRVPDHTPHFWVTLKQKFPLAFNNLFHLFLLGNPPYLSKI